MKSILIYIFIIHLTTASFVNTTEFWAQSLGAPLNYQAYSGIILFYNLGY